MYDNEYKIIDSFNHRISFQDIPPKYVILNSTGGNVYNATPVCEYIQRHGIDTIAEGTCQSAAFFVFTSGKRRLSYPSTLFMMHGSEISGGTKENIKKNKEVYHRAFIKPWIDKMVKMSNKPSSYWEDIVSHPDKHYYWTAHELKAMGVVTHIIGEDL